MVSMSNRTDLVVLPGLVLPWNPHKGYWQLLRNGVAISVHPRGNEFVVKLAPDWREAKRSRYVAIVHTVEGLFDYLLESWLLDVVMTEELQGAHDGQREATAAVE